MVEKSKTASKLPYAPEELTRVSRSRYVLRPASKAEGEDLPRSRVIWANNAAASRIVDGISLRAFRQAKLGIRRLEVLELLNEDFVSGNLSACSIEDPSIFHYGSTPFFLSRMLLQAGFALEAEISDRLKAGVLVMSW